MNDPVYLVDNSFTLMRDWCGALDKYLKFQDPNKPDARQFAMENFPPLLMWQREVMEALLQVNERLMRLEAKRVPREGGA